ncbi:LytR/AlgR family response regulator transcription factor [Pedobacter sp. GSP4]|uniref:LytR/AlgR family response regulator transcription factor n=1 Tax=Pedobacter sp. GSP4 TaxID=3453716 RepID=UPI003EEC9331
MIPFSCIIVDDEPIALKLLAGCIGKISSLNLVKAYSDPVLALQEIITSENMVDFAFIDVEMPGLNGVLLAEKIAHKANNIVLVSAHIVYAIDGYNVNAKHFLYKPFDFESFESMIGRIINNLAKEKPYIMVTLGSKMQVQRVYVDEIIAIKGNGNYINIHTINGVLVSYYKLSDMEHDLKIFLFMKRISKSYIISIKHIEKVEGFAISLKNNLNLSVGESYRSDFKKSIKKLLYSNLT